MTREEKVVLIRAKCIEANPEIVELKFGCAYKVENRKELFIVNSDFAIQTIGNLKPKIIGRRITLADILLVLNESVKGCQYGLTPMFGCEYGRFIFQDANAGTFMGDEPVWWYKKPIEDQDEKTIDFLYDLIRDVGWRNVEELKPAAKGMSGSVGTYGNF